MSKTCTDCKWGVLKYNKIYGGFAIGCQNPSRVYKTQIGDGCFQPKEMKNAK